jgi:hypothetical protein
MAKANKEAVEKISQMVRRSNQAIFLAVASIFLVVLIILSFLVLFSSLDRNLYEQPPLDGGEKLIGGDRDQGGCLVGAGYSWCEIKKKCLRVWEEPCSEEQGPALTGEAAVKKYIEDNISFLAPQQTDSGVFNVSEVNFISDQTAFIGYDDGENFYNAEAVFRISSADEVLIEKFIVKNENGNESDLQICKSDDDCVPLPSECHPHSCINKDKAGDYKKPEICTMMFDAQAAYEAKDCACDVENSECYNKNIRKVSDIQ